MEEKFFLRFEDPVLTEVPDGNESREEEEEEEDKDAVPPEWLLC